MSQGQRIALIFDTDVASFMPVLVIRKFDEISIEKKVAVPGTTFPPL